MIAIAVRIAAVTTARVVNAFEEIVVINKFFSFEKKE